MQKRKSEKIYGTKRENLLCPFSSLLNHFLGGSSFFGHFSFSGRRSEAQGSWLTHNATLIIMYTLMECHQSNHNPHQQELAIQGPGLALL